MAKHQADKIVRSNRKTIGLQITTRGEIIVRAPNQTSLRDIEKVLDKSKRWIDKKLQKVSLIQAKIRPKNFTEGEEFLYLGEKYKLVFRKSTSKTLDLHDNFIIDEKLINQPKRICEAFESWYREEMRSYASDKISIYAKILEVSPNKIRISGAKTRWGSCSGKRNLNFCWRLIMAPEEIVDYVIVHELCHLREMNHSKNFWGLVDDIFPDWKEKRKWLKQNGDFLVL